MAAKAISQRISLEGAEDIRRNLDQVGRVGERAFADLRRSAANLNFQAVGRQLQEVGAAAAKVANDAAKMAGEAGKAATSLQAVGTSAQEASVPLAQASAGTTSFAQSLGTIVKAAAVAVGALATVRAAWLSVKNAAAAASEIGKSADALGQDDIDSYQRLNFVLRQLGLTSGEADAAIKKMGEEAEDSAVKLSKTALELQKVFQARGVSFAPTAQGFNLMRRELASLAQKAAQGTIPFGQLRDMLERFKDETDPRQLRVFQNELAKLIEGANGVAPAMRGVINVLRDSKKEATGIVTPLQEVRNALSAMQKDTSPENVVRFAAALTGLEDEATRTKFAVSAMGEVAGRRLVRELKQSDSAITSLIARYQQLRIGVSDADREIGDKFNAALTEMAVVSRQSKTELGLLFAPALTGLIRTYNTLMRDNSGLMIRLGTAIREAVIPPMQAFLDLIPSIARDFNLLLQGLSEGDVENKWLLTLRDGLTAVGTLINSIIKPAIESLKAGFATIASLINQAFGTKLSAADVGIAGLITFLLGGVNTLGVALLALFNDKAPAAVQAFKKSLKSIGIDIDAIKKLVTGFATSVAKDMKAIFEGRTGEVQNKWLLDIKKILTSLPVILVGVIAGFTALGRAIRFIGADKAILLFLAQFTGLLPLITTLLVGLAAVVTILATIGSVIGWPVTLAAGLVVLLSSMERAKVVFDSVATALNSIFGTRLDGLDLQIGAVLGLVAAVALLATRVAAARTALLSLSAIPIVAAFLGIHQVVKDLAGSGGPLDALDNKIEKLGRDLVAGKITLQEYEQQVAKLRNVSAAATTKDTAPGIAEEWKKITESLKGVSTQSNQTVQTVKNGWAQVSPGVWQKLSSDAGRAADQIDAKWKQLAPGVFQRVGTDTKRATDNIKRGVDEVGTSIDGLELTPIQRIDQTFSELSSTISRVEPVTRAAADVVAVMDRALDGLASGAAGVDPLAGLKTSAEGLVLPIQNAGIAATTLGTNLTQAGQAGAGAFQGIAGMLQTLPTTIEGFLATLSRIPQSLTSGTEASTQFANALTQAMNGAKSPVDQLAAAVDALMAKFEAAIAKARELASARVAGGGDGAFGEFNPEGFARGGRVWGPGTSTSDSIPARLSRGEFVQREKAVRYYGADFMAALNALRIPKDLFSGFSVGGLADGLNRSLSSLMIPRFAAGGLTDMAPARVAAGGRSLTLVLDRQHFDFSGTEDTVARFEKRVMAQQASSTGRKPSWVGGGGR